MSPSTFRELLQWQSHLAQTFGSLDATRNRPKGKPFFVLEPLRPKNGSAELSQTPLEIHIRPLQPLLGPLQEFWVINP